MKSVFSIGCAALALCWTAGAQADGGYGAWSLAVPVEAINATGGGGCPIETADGLSLMIASGRTGTQGLLDIWVSDRASLADDWSVPVNLPGPVNGANNDLCPTPVLGRSLLFVSDRSSDEQPACGMSGGDIHLTRQSPSGVWSEPVQLGCAPDGPNFAGAERSPILVEMRFGTYLLYSSSDDGGDADIFWSRQRADGTFGPGHRVWGANSDAEEIMPYVRRRENGLLEMVFSSTRTDWGRRGAPAFGSQDVYVSFAIFPWGPWSEPVNLGENVNTVDPEQRATLSADGKRLYFGRPSGVWTSERVVR